MNTRYGVVAVFLVCTNSLWSTDSKVSPDRFEFLSRHGVAPRRSFAERPEYRDDLDLHASAARLFVGHEAEPAFASQDQVERTLAALVMLATFYTQISLADFPQQESTKPPLVPIKEVGSTLVAQITLLIEKFRVDGLQWAKVDLTRALVLAISIIENLTELEVENANVKQIAVADLEALIAEALSQSVPVEGFMTLEEVGLINALMESYDQAAGLFKGHHDIPSRCVDCVIEVACKLLKKLLFLYSYNPFFAPPSDRDNAHKIYVLKLHARCADPGFLMLVDWVGKGIPLLTAKRKTFKETKDVRRLTWERFATKPHFDEVFRSFKNIVARR